MEASSDSERQLTIHACESSKSLDSKVSSLSHLTNSLSALSRIYATLFGSIGIHFKVSNSSSDERNQKSVLAYLASKEPESRNFSKKTFEEWEIISRKMRRE